MSELSSIVWTGVGIMAVVLVLVTAATWWWANREHLGLTTPPGFHDRQAERLAKEWKRRERAYNYHRRIAYYGKE